MINTQRIDKKPREKPKKRVSIGPLKVFEYGRYIGIAFINYVIRKTRTLNLIIQIRDQKNRKVTLETFLVRIPLGAIPILDKEIIGDGAIKLKGNRKWKVIRT